MTYLWLFSWLFSTLPIKRRALELKTPTRIVFLLLFEKSARKKALMTSFRSYGQPVFQLRLFILVDCFTIDFFGFNNIVLKHAKSIVSLDIILMFAFVQSLLDGDDILCSISYNWLLGQNIKSFGNIWNHALIQLTICFIDSRPFKALSSYAIICYFDNSWMFRAPSLIYMGSKIHPICISGELSHDLVVKSPFASYNLLEAYLTIHFWTKIHIIF